jgi:protein ImuB
MATFHQLNPIKRRVACVLLPGGEKPDLSALAEACFRFSPPVAIRAGEAVFIEVGGSRALFSEESIQARLKVLAGRLLKGVAVRVAIADTAETALAAARYPDYARTRNLRDLPLAALGDYAHPFLWDADLEKRVLRIRCILESLGVRNMGEFALLPRESLASRLGKEALGLMGKVWGEGEHAWPGFRPPARIVERDEVRDPEAHGLCADLEGCVFVLKGLLDRMMARLRGRCERVSAMEIRFLTASKTTDRMWRIELPLPQGSVAGLLPILRERLSYELQRQPLRCPVEAMEIEVLESVPGAGTQRDFFSKKEEEKEAWDGLVARLSARLGKDRVFVAFPQERHLPERAYIRKLVSVPVLGTSLAASMVRKVEQTEWPDRPARVLKKPEPLAKDGRVLRSPEGRQWKAISWEGPERLAGEWWKGWKGREDPQSEGGFNRDYYRVITEGGDQLWVFVHKDESTSEVPSFYLHGYFD